MQSQFQPAPLDYPEKSEESKRMDKHYSAQLLAQRKNMLSLCRMCVKSLVDKSAFEVISDDCPHLHNLCNTLEHVLTHRLLPRWSFFGSEVPCYWVTIQQYAPAITVGSIDDMHENLMSDLGKSRAWLRLALVQKKLADFMNTLLSKTDELKASYLSGAFLLSDEMTELAGTLRCLDAIDFNLCLRDQDFDFGEKFELDYTPYLRFSQSKASISDDLREETKLRSPIHAPPTASLEGLSEGGDGEESVTQLRELLKTEREQKNYYEELVSVRGSQLSRLQSEVDRLTVECDRQKSEMDDIVLELQQQISQLQRDLRDAEHRAREGRPSTRSASVSSNGTSSKRKSGSFLSSLFSSGDNDS